MKVKKIEVMETGLENYVGEPCVIFTTKNGRKFRLYVEIETIEDGEDVDPKRG